MIRCDGVRSAAAGWLNEQMRRRRYGYGTNLLEPFTLSLSKRCARFRQAQPERLGYWARLSYLKPMPDTTPPDTTLIDRAVLRMADELRYDAVISDATWADLRKTYSDQQVMELLFTSAQYQLVSMALNTLGIQIEPQAVDFIPKDVALPATAARPNAPRLTTPRIPAIEPANWTPEQRALIAPQTRPDGTVFNLYKTLINHPKLYTPRARFGSYLQRDSLLDPETRELAILRTAWNIRTNYEWAHHYESAKSAGLTDAQITAIATGPSAPGWNARQRAVLTAADELRREAFVSDATWAELANYYGIKERIEIVYTVGGYTMTGLAINSFGIQTEPGYPAMPNQ